jgi:hypothetical protein
MAFPQTPLPAIVSIAPGADASAGPDTWEGLWTNITADVRVDDGVVITGGRSDEANQVDATDCKLRLDNRSGNYSPRNALGLYYGKLKKNCPIKVEVQRAQDTFARTVAAGWGTSDIGLTWTQADASPNFPLSVSAATGGVMGLAAANSVNTNLVGLGGSWNTDVLMEFSVPVVPAGAAWITGVQMRRLTASTYMAVSVAIQAGGQVDVTIDRFYAAASRFIVASQTAALATYTAGRKIWVRARAYGQIFYARVWYDGSPEPTTWTTTFTETSAGLQYDSEDGTNLLNSNVGLYSWRVSGNTNTTQANFWAYSSTAPVFIGNVVEWPVRWDESANDCTVPVTASGIIRRLSQGQAPLGSPLYKTYTGESTDYAYWPLEDDSGALTAFGRGTGVKPATVYQASFGYSGLKLGGATSTMTVTQNTTITGILPRTVVSAASGWTMIFYILMEALPPSGQDATVMQIRASGTKVLYSIIVMNGGILGYQSVDANGVGGAVGVLGAGSFAAAAWYEVRLEAYQPANLAVRMTTINLTTGVVTQGTFADGAGSLGIPNSWSIYGSSTSFPAGSVGHVSFFNYGAVFTTTQTLAAARGYAGETASARVKRLCTEQRVPVQVLSDSTTLMGAQSTGTFLSLLRECETADLGVLYETNYTPGLGYRPRTARYSTAVRYALTFAAGYIAEPPEPTDDDRSLRNDWTVSRVGGSSAQVTDPVSIAQQGRYDDSVDINVSTDDVLLSHAGLRVFLGTLDGLRWPKIEWNMARTPALISPWLSSLVGTRFTITGTPGQLPGETIDVLIEGWTQTLSSYVWDVELNCSPAPAWSRFLSVASAGGPASDDARIDSGSSYLATAINSSVTSMSVARVAPDSYWDTTAVPFDVLMGGERMTVTAISGVGNPQTFTVTRAVNAITKAHLVNETVSLWTPAYVAL